MAVYTKRGDKGNTSLFTKPGKTETRVSKESLRIGAIGSIDELNSYLGVANSYCDNPEISKIIFEIQTTLFRINSILAGSNLILAPKKAKDLEKIIDKLEGSLPTIKNFVYPTGSRLSVHLQFSRSLARRAERATTALSKEEKVKPEILIYLNRLSDTIFVLARKVNFDQSIKEIYWSRKKRS